jgi:MFS family permease
MLELGFDAKTSALVLAMMVVSGLPTNLVAGWLLGKLSIGRVLAFGMAFMAATLAFYPFVVGKTHLIIYGLGLGVAGGVVTVVHAAIYAHAFGRSSLGRIQTAAQIVSTLASASGPVWIDATRKSVGTPFFFYVASAAAVLLGVCALANRIPNRSKGEFE